MTRLVTPACWCSAGVPLTVPVAAAARRVRAGGQKVAHAHLRHLHPFPANTGEVLKRYEKVLIPEMNLGQLAMLIRARFLVDAISYDRVRGLPFKAAELADVIRERHRDRADRRLRRRGSHGMNRLLDLVPKAEEKQTRKEFTSGVDVRWCPGCGDYAILATVQGFLPEVGVKRENIVFISGIGCSSRFPYYVETYGMHSIHGRAPAIATGLATSRPDLSVWVVTGDGDALSIGGNHLIHALRRNVNLTILLFNNQIYGLTKGQYSPTSEQGKITKSTPMGSLDRPFNPVSLALGAEATFVARSIDSDRAHLTSVLRAANDHPGTSLVEIYQNCNIFNDGAFDLLKDKDTRDDAGLRLEAGQPMVFGADLSRGVRRNAARAAWRFATPPTRASSSTTRSVEDPTTAFALSRLTGVTPIGVFRDVDRPSYDELMNEQLVTAKAQAGRGRPDGTAAQRRHLVDVDQTAT